MNYRVEIVAPVNGRLRPATVRILGEDGATLATDEAALGAMARRERVVRNLCRQMRARGLKPKAKEVAGKLEASWNSIDAQHRARQAEDAQAGQPASNDAPRLTQADHLVRLAQGAELFHTPGGCDSEGYATVAVGDHRETWPIASNGFRRRLSKSFYDAFAKAPGAQAVQDALNVIAGKAVHEGAEHEVAVRLAEQGGAIWLDLCDADWRAVRVTASGWSVARGCPVKFVRRRGMLALPEPARGGNVNDLRGLVNVPDADSWALIVACLLAALRPGRPFPVLAVNGEQGSAKSTLCRMLRALIDPNQAPLRRPPREDRDLMIAATNSWVIAFDNLSGIRSELSDALCSLATGGGFGTRELYTDDSEKLFSAMRPVFINGIEEVVSRPDLLDRAVVVTLPPLDETQRRDEEQLWRDFEAVRPGVLGALLDAVSVALRNRPGVRLTHLPRMADFAAWVVAAEPALGWPPGTFLAAYAGNRSAGATAALENSVLYPVLGALLKDRPYWQGTARQLLDDLNTKADEKIRRHRDWPASPRRLGGDMRRLAPSLRAAGVGVTFTRESGGGRRRLIDLEQAGVSSSLPPQPSQTAANPQGEPGRSRDGSDDGDRSGSANCPAQSPAGSALWDGRGDRDDVLPPDSNCDHGDAWEPPEDSL
jgi:hypothetical protein